MPRKGENIYKRKDGRWEARYIYAFKEDGSPRYRSIYAADYLTVKKKQNDAKRKMDPRLFQSVRMKKNISFYGLLWLERLKPSSKESTYVRYHYLFSHYISPMIGDRLVYTFSNKDCEVFLNRLLVSGKRDGSGLAPKTVTDIRSVVKLILKTAEKEGELSLCNPELCPVKPVKKPLRILSLKEQQALQDYLLGNLTHKNIGTLIALYTGVRLGELCAMQWKDIHFQEQYLEISKTLMMLLDLKKSLLPQGIQTYGVGLMVWHLLLNFSLTWILSKSISYSCSAENAPIESKGSFGKAMDSYFFIKD